MGKSKVKISRHKRRTAPSKIGPKVSSHTGAKGPSRPSLKDLAEEFAEKRTGVDDRALTPFQRRMLSGGA